MSEITIFVAESIIQGAQNILCEQYWEWCGDQPFETNFGIPGPNKEHWGWVSRL